MKGKIFVFSDVAAIIAVVVINLNIALKRDFEANLILANIVSLAKGEEPSKTEK